MACCQGATNELSSSRAKSPVVNVFELAHKVLMVSATTVELERLAHLSTVAYALGEPLNDRSVRSLGDRRTVQGAATRGRGAHVVDVVHPGKWRDARGQKKKDLVTKEGREGTLWRGSVGRGTALPLRRPR
jgi:hypothetical protein